jgi:hypothetical protein
MIDVWQSVTAQGRAKHGIRKEVQSSFGAETQSDWDENNQSVFFQQFCCSEK